MKNCQHGSNSGYFHLQKARVWRVKEKLIFVRDTETLDGCVCVLFSPHTVLQRQFGLFNKTFYFTAFLFCYFQE